MIVRREEGEVKTRIKWMLAICAQCTAVTAMAAGPAGGVYGLIGSVNNLANSISLPVVGPLGGVSLGSLDALPVVGKLNLPIVNGNPGQIPILGQVTVSDGLVLVQSVYALQQVTLPGLEGLSVK